MYTPQVGESLRKQHHWRRTAMTMFVPMTANVEVNGETVLSVVDGMGLYKTKALAILEKNGMKDPKPGSWYSQKG